MPFSQLPRPEAYWAAQILDASHPEPLHGRMSAENNVFEMLWLKPRQEIHPPYNGRLADHEVEAISWPRDLRYTTALIFNEASWHSETVCALPETRMTATSQSRISS